MAHDIFFIIPDCVGVETSVSLGRDINGGRQSKSTGQSVCSDVLVRQVDSANNGILAGDVAALDHSNTKNDPEMKKEAHKHKLHMMAKVYD